MVTTTQARATHEEVDAYVRRCGFFLDDLPTDVQVSLEHDVREIALEVAAELDGDPADLLGQPSLFVADLRSAAGLAPYPGVVDEAAPSARSLSLMMVLNNWTRSTAFPWCKQLAHDLRPAWWVARGVGFALVLDANHLQNGSGLVPNLFGWSLAWLIVAMALVVTSVRVGRAGRPNGMGRGYIIGATGVIALILIVQDLDSVRQSNFLQSQSSYLESDAAVDIPAAVEVGQDQHSAIRVYDNDSNQLLLSRQGSSNDLVTFIANNEFSANSYRVELDSANGDVSATTVYTWDAVTELVLVHRRVEAPNQVVVSPLMPTEEFTN